MSLSQPPPPQQRAALRVQQLPDITERRSGLKRGASSDVTEHAQDNPAPAIPGEGLVCQGKQLFPDTGAVQTQWKAQATREV